jgi:CRP-like cAMP-binding protein
MSETPNTLDSIPLLESLDSEEREALTKQCRFRRFEAGEQIIDRDQETTDIYFVIRGRVRIAIFSLSGREVAFDDLNDGQFFGELAGIDRGRRSATAVAIKPTRVAMIDARRFLELVCAHQEVVEALLRHLASVIRRSTERIMDLSTLGANNRVHAEILRLARPTLDEDTNTAEIRPIPVHGEIGARVSTARETVARVFSDLTKAGILERHSDHILVADFEQLEEMVEDVRGEV